MCVQNLQPLPHKNDPHACNFDGLYHTKLHAILLAVATLARIVALGDNTLCFYFLSCNYCGRRVLLLHIPM